MRFAKWFFRGGKTSEQQVVPSVVSPVLVAGRVAKDSSVESLRRDAVTRATLMFGRRLVGAPSGWLLAPCAGVVTAELAGRRAPGSGADFCVSFAPGWGLGVLPDLSPRFLLIEARALVTGAWAGALEPGGEHLLDELFALVDLAKELRVTPVLLDNADALLDCAPASFTFSSALGRLRAAVPAVVSPQGAEDSVVAPSPVLRELLDYVQGAHCG